MRKIKKYLSLSWVVRHKFLSALLALAFIAAGVYGYQVYAKHANKVAFEQARAAIDTIYADIVAQVGPPDNYKRENSCSVYTEVFKTGPTYCDVDASFIYGVKDKEEANSLFKKIQSLISTHRDLLTPTKPLSPAISSMLVVNSYYHAASDEYKSSGLDCIVNYVYDTPREVSLVLKDTSKKPFQVSIGCHALARDKYYTVTN